MSETLRPILENQSQFMGFLYKHVHDQTLAADILQDALLKAVRHADSLHTPEAAVGWFYKVLRNSMTDHFRRSGRESQRIDWGTELDQLEADEDLREDVCGCLLGIVDTLKEDYATIIRAVDIEDVSVKDFALANQISPNNASVRLFRARQSLLKEVQKCCGGGCAESGCRDCNCEPTPA